jgi:predicted nucleic acid-binding protein
MSGAEPALSFVDTNILVYAFGGHDSRRSPIAQALVRNLMATQALQTSTQVLQELFVVLTRKLRTPITAKQALLFLDQLGAWPVTVLDYGALRNAVELSMEAKLSLWDALIIIAAARSGSQRLYTEDLQHGQVIRGVEIVNPFESKN